jgi:hypothetical protein
VIFNLPKHIKEKTLAKLITRVILRRKGCAVLKQIYGKVFKLPNLFLTYPSQEFVIKTQI